MHEHRLSLENATILDRWYLNQFDLDPVDVVCIAYAHLPSDDETPSPQCCVNDYAINLIRSNCPGHENSTRTMLLYCFQTDLQKRMVIELAHPFSFCPKRCSHCAFLPKIRKLCMPQNVCIPSIGTFESTIRSTSKRFNDPKIGLIVMLFLGP